MIALDRKYRSQGLVVLGISREDRETQHSFGRQERVPYPLLLQKDSMPRPYSEVRAVPTTFIIDRHGVLREVVVGYDKEALEKSVTALLHEEIDYL